jgi:hypothetical protein
MNNKEKKETKTEINCNSKTNTQLYKIRISYKWIVKAKKGFISENLELYLLSTQSEKKTNPHHIC